MQQRVPLWVQGGLWGAGRGRGGKQAEAFCYAVCGQRCDPPSCRPGAPLMLPRGTRAAYAWRWRCVEWHAPQLLQVGWGCR